MMYLMMQALAELAVMYPINGAFTMYICRFIDPSWGFACGWQYAISWLQEDDSSEISGSAALQQDVTLEAVDLRARSEAASASVDRLTQLIAQAAILGP